MIPLIIIINIIVSILHPLKYIPLCLHINHRESVDDISVHYIQGEILLNGISITISISMLFSNVHNILYFLPIIFEKALSFGMIIYIGYLKHKYSSNNILNEEDNWNSVDSIEDNDLNSVDSIEDNDLNSVSSIEEENWNSVDSIEDDLN